MPTGMNRLHFKLKPNVLCLVTQLCPTHCNPMDCSLPGSSVHRDSPGKNTEVGCHALLQIQDTTTCKIENQQRPTI